MNLKGEYLLIFLSSFDHPNNDNIDFLCTAFDINSLDFLIDEIGIKFIKIPSGEINNFELLDHVKKKRKPIFLSTGLSTQKDVDNALNFLGFRKVIKKNSRIKKKIENNISILHCISEYPAPIKEANIKVIKKFLDSYNCRIGYSDHCEGFSASLSAVANGASIIEKHITTNTSLNGPDHSISIEKEDLKNMIQMCNEIFHSLGNEEKKPTKSEKKNIKIIRRSIFATKYIRKGEVFCKKNITCKRPQVGMKASDYFKVIGKRASKEYFVNDVIKERV